MPAYSRTYEIRWSDLDANGHVNYAAYIDATGDVRYHFFSEHGYPPEKFIELGISPIYTAIQAPGGYEAVQLRVAEQYITQFGQLAKAGTSLVIPSNLADVGSIIAAAMNVIQARGGAPARPSGPAR